VNRTWPLLLTRIDIAELRVVDSGQPLLDLVLEDLERAARREHPRGQMLPPERHRGYAVQWFGLSLTILIIYCRARAARLPRRADALSPSSDDETPTTATAADRGSPFALPALLATYDADALVPLGARAHAQPRRADQVPVIALPAMGDAASVVSDGRPLERCWCVCPRSCDAGCDPADTA
jgi:hypothetical protein